MIADFEAIKHELVRFLKIQLQTNNRSLDSLFFCVYKPPLLIEFDSSLSNFSYNYLVQVNAYNFIYFFFSIKLTSNFSYNYVVQLFLFSYFK
jgi:hypothetical protein